MSNDNDYDVSPEELAKLTRGGVKMSGGFDGPSWMPALHPSRSDLKEEIRAKKAADVKGGAIIAQVLRGTVIAEFAWGRRAYFLDAKKKDDTTVRVKLPEHGSVYGALNSMQLGAPVVVVYQGLGKAKAGRSAPHLYDITCLDPAKALSSARPDALVIESMDDRKKREEKAAAAAAGADDVDDVDFPPR